MPDHGSDKPPKPDFKNTGTLKERQLLGAAAGLSGGNNSSQMYSGNHFESGGNGRGSRVGSQGPNHFGGGLGSNAGSYGSSPGKSSTAGAGSVAASTPWSAVSGGGVSFSGGGAESEKSYEQIAREALESVRASTDDDNKDRAAIASVKLTPSEKAVVEMDRQNLIDKAIRENKRSDPDTIATLKRLNDKLGVKTEDINEFWAKAAAKPGVGSSGAGSSPIGSIGRQAIESEKSYEQIAREALESVQSSTGDAGGPGTAKLSQAERAVAERDKQNLIERAVRENTRSDPETLAALKRLNEKLGMQSDDTNGSWTKKR